MVAMLGVLLGVPAAPASAMVEYFRDDFAPASADEKFFFEGRLGDKLFSYREGRYVIDASGAEDYGHSVLLHELASYELEAQGRLSGGTPPRVIGGQVTKAGWGLSFNYQESPAGEERFLLALVNPAERNFSLQRVDGSHFTNLLAPSVCEHIRSGDNVLRVKVDAGRISAYVNGQPVGEVFETDLLSGGFGLYVTPGSVSEFEYLAVYTEAVPTAVVEDDFGGTPARWFTGSQDGVDYSYASGEYVIDAVGSAMAGISLFAGEHAEFELEVSVRKLEGPDNAAYGVFFQDVPNEQGGYDQYRFLISNDGWFTVQRSFEDLPRALFQWAECGRLRKNAPNRLRVKLLPGKLGFYLNGYLVYDLQDMPAVAGKLGLYTAAGVKAAYDDFRLADF